MTKLEVGKKYNVSNFEYNPVEIIAISPCKKYVWISDIENDFLTLPKGGRIWQEYQEHDIFDGIEVGDVVTVDFAGKVVGFVTKIEEERIWLSESMDEEPHRYFVKNKRLIIQKQTPEEK